MGGTGLACYVKQRLRPSADINCLLCFGVIEAVTVPNRVERFAHSVLPTWLSGKVTTTANMRCANSTLKVTDGTGASSGIGHVVVANTYRIIKKHRKHPNDAPQYNEKDHHF